MERLRERLSKIAREQEGEARIKGAIKKGPRTRMDSLEELKHSIVEQMTACVPKIRPLLPNRRPYSHMTMLPYHNDPSRMIISRIFKRRCALPSTVLLPQARPDQINKLA